MKRFTNVYLRPSKSGPCYRGQVHDSLGHCYYTSTCETEREAAEARDNLVYYLNLAGLEPEAQLDFPDVYYNGDHTPPEASEVTLRAVERFKARKEGRKKWNENPSVVEAQRVLDALTCHLQQLAKLLNEIATNTRTWAPQALTPEQQKAKDERATKDWLARCEADKERERHCEEAVETMPDAPVQSPAFSDTEQSLAEEAEAAQRKQMEADVWSCIPE